MMESFIRLTDIFKFVRYNESSMKEIDFFTDHKILAYISVVIIGLLLVFGTMGNLLVSFGNFDIFQKKRGLHNSPYP